jgi:hypothetical protein
MIYLLSPFFGRYGFQQPELVAFRLPEHRHPAYASLSGWFGDVLVAFEYYIAGLFKSP